MNRSYLLMFCAALLLLCAGCTQTPQTVSNLTPVTISNTTPGANSSAPAVNSTVPPAVNSTVPAANSTPPAANSTVPPVPHTVKTATDPNLGTILVDGNGMTLYVFTKDSINESSCYDKCAGIWSALNGSAITRSLPGKLGTIQRSDGTSQATYNGMPLYYYSGDQKAGDVNGNGIGGVWFVVPPEIRFFPREMSASEASMVADISACLAVGNLTNVSIYNNYTSTWWIDLDTVKSGCSPACVVYANMSADVNWRCTGLIVPPVPVVPPTVNTNQSTQW